MLTIPEEFLLLTIKDEDGGFVDIPREAVSAGFIGAAIMELALQNRIDSDLERIWIVDKKLVGEPCVELLRVHSITIDGPGLVGFGDGEMIGATPLRVDQVPAALRICRPEL